MQFIKFTQCDPDYPSRLAEVVVQVGQIVKIEPVWFETKGVDRYLCQVERPGEEELFRGLEKCYRVFDSLGNVYDSDSLSADARDHIERIWLNAG